MASFAAATGQGEHDIAASPGLTGNGGACGTIFCFPLSPNSPAIDSADANASGETTTDQLDNPRADDPSVPDTGTGAGYYDRGAIELEGPIDNGSLTVRADPADGPLSVSASAPMTTPWITNGSIGVEAFYFSDTSLPSVTSATTAGVGHTFGVAGAYEVEVLEGLGDFFEPGYQTQTTVVVVGADYTPVTPTRILDTRSGIGAAEAPIPPGAKLILEIPDIGQVSASDLSAIAVNVTVTDPAAAGSVTVYTQSGAGAATSNVNFSKGQTIADLVTIKPAGTDVTFQNNSRGTVQVVADLDGYYSNSGSGFQPVSPVRVLDTRNRTGTTAPGPVPSHAVVRLNLSGKVPAGTTAAVLNLTATGPTAPGFVTAYADGQPLPGASSLNFAARQTIPNLVVVPLAGDVADLYNGSSGSVQLVADLDGYFESEAASAFVPYGPLRIVDTRVGLGTAVVGAVPARGTLVITPNAATGATAAVLNVAVTQAKAAGYLTVYPHNGSLPASSNVNFSAGQTVANLVMVPMANGQVAIYNGSSGSVQIIVDEQGYYISQP